MGRRARRTGRNTHTDCAIDLDPLENPYVSNGTTSHAGSQPYLDRQRVRTRPGVISDGGVVTRIFDRLGWGWGGRWSGPRDYQHLSASGRCQCRGVRAQAVLPRAIARRSSALSSTDSSTPWARATSRSERPLEVASRTIALALS